MFFSFRGAFAGMATCRLQSSGPDAREYNAVVGEPLRVFQTQLPMRKGDGFAWSVVFRCLSTAKGRALSLSARVGRIRLL
jgi:hypothetical protein